MLGKIVKTAAILLTAFLAGAAVAYAYQLLTIQTTGNIDLAYGLTATPDRIDWGTITALGTPTTRQVTLTNTGTKPIASLNMTYGNAVNLTAYTLTWNLEDTPLEVGAEAIATFTLTITEATEGPFSLDINVNDEA